MYVVVCVWRCSVRSACVCATARRATRRCSGTSTSGAPRSSRSAATTTRCHWTPSSSRRCTAPPTSSTGQRHSIIRDRRASSLFLSAYPSRHRLLSHSWQRDITVKMMVMRFYWRPSASMKTVVVMQLSPLSEFALHILHRLSVCPLERKGQRNERKALRESKIHGKIVQCPYHRHVAAHFNSKDQK